MTKQDVVPAAKFSLLLGIPVEKEAMTGTIDGSNKTFVVANPPIFCKNKKKITPGADDVRVYRRKGTTDTVVDLATTTPIGLVTDEDTDDEIYGSVTTATAPASETADGMYISYAEECLAQLNVKMDPSFKQDTDDIKPIGTTDVITAYGNKTREMKAELTVNTATLALLRKLHYTKSEEQTGVETGFTHYVENDEPLDIYAAIPIRNKTGDIIEYYHLESCKIPIDFPSVKGGDSSVSVNCNITIGESINLLALTET